MIRPRTPARRGAALAGIAALSACGSTGATGTRSPSPRPSVATQVGTAGCSYGPGSLGTFRPDPPRTNGGSDHAQVVPEMPHDHVTPPTRVVYAHDPPTSGCHYSLGYGQAPITAGVHPATPVVPAEHWVHNLEHGYVAVLYNCPQGCDADVQSLTLWLRRQAPDPGLKARPGVTPYAKVIVIPWPSMTPRFAAVFWDYYDPMDRLDLAELQRFYDNHLDTGPEGPNTP
ncbi:MAG TPA: DUF3105 domain-containing protein [Candidatus Dormibacteraeota bacterium]|jgi:hypothetical protein